MSPRFLIFGLVLLACMTPRPASAQIVNTLRGFNEKDRGWSGDVEGTVAVANGNTEYFEFELTGAVQFQTQRNRVRLMGRSMRRTASGEEVAEDRLGHLRHNYLIHPRFDTIAFVQGQHNPFRRIRLRALAGVGGRFDVARGDKWNTSLGATVMYEHEELTETENTTTKWRYSFFLTVYREVERGLDVDLTAFYQPAVDDFGDARGLAAASMRVDLVGNLYFLLTYRLEHDSEPPVGVDQTDQTLRSGLGYKF